MADRRLITVGRGVHSGLRLPLSILSSNEGVPLPQPCLKLVLFTSGTGPVRVNGRRILVTAPALLCLNHRENLRAPKNLAWTATLFLPELLNAGTTIGLLEKLPSAELASQLDDYWAEAFRPTPNRKPRLLSLPPLAYHRFHDNMRRLNDELTGQKCVFWPQWARAFLNEMLFLLAQLSHLDTGEPAVTADFPEHPAAPIVLHLRQHHQERLSLDRLARIFHTNRTTLQKHFRAYTGRSVGAYLRELRLAMARTLLSGSNAKVEEIAEKVGFRDVTHFIRAFRRSFGQTPARYRRQLATP